MILSAAVLPAFGQSQTPAAVDPEAIQKLLKRIESLEKEVHTLRGASSAAPAEALPTVEKETFPKVDFHGFGDVTYKANDSDNGAKNTFTLGQLDLFVTSRIAENISILDEMVIEAGGDNGFGFEIERLLLQYRFNDYFNLDIGRYHSAVGYYNTAYHHGAWFQTAVGRPAFLDFEDGGGIIPAHNVGLALHGDIPSGKLGFAYTLEVGNGRAYQKPGTASDLVLNVQDDNGYKAIHAAFTAKPEWVPGLQVGAGLYHDTLTSNLPARTDEEIIHGHAVWKKSPWEFLSEAYLIRHAEHGGSEHWSSAFFVQGARKFGDFTPYARYSYLNANEADAVYKLLDVAGRHHGPAIGVRYDFSNFAAFKAQLDHFIQSTGDDVNQVTFQASFTF